MSKTLIVVMGLSLVLVSGGLFSVQADGGPRPAIQSPPLYGCVSCRAARDRDLSIKDRGSQPKNDWERDEMNGPVSPY
jgi:hypothetical protein